MVMVTAQGQPYHIMKAGTEMNKAEHKVSSYDILLVAMYL